MKNLLILLSLTAFTVFFTACEKESNTQETVTATINNPTEGVTMNDGDNLNVNAVFTDPTELHNYSVVVVNETANLTLLDISGHSHEMTYTVDSTIVLSVMAHSDFMIIATATNHSGETATDTVHFHVHP